MDLDNQILDIALNRTKIISCGNDSTNLMTNELKVAFLSEIANLGYVVSNPERFVDSILVNYDRIITTLISSKGGDVDYVPLFKGFPNEVPEKNEYFYRRVIGILGNSYEIFKEGRAVSDMIIPEWLFNVDEFGADPILGRQVHELLENGIIDQDNRKSDTHTELTTLHFVSDEEMKEKLQEYLLKNLYSKSSIKESLKDDLRVLINYYGISTIDPLKVVFKETQSYVMVEYWNTASYVKLSNFVKSPTDILRMFASLTNTDISLSGNIRFPKLSRSQRRFVLESLNKFSNLAELLNPYKGLWLELGRYIHPGEYRNRYSNTFNAFDILRNGKVVTFNSKVESAIKDNNLNDLLNLLSKKPGIFGRKLHEILVKFPVDFDIILSKFSDISEQIELKNLLVMESYFKTINDLESRIIINKLGKIIALPNSTKGKLNDLVINKLIDIIQCSIKYKLSNINEINADMNTNVDMKVWIDDELLNYTIPLQQRKMSDGLLSLGRGTRLKFDDENVLRMFAYWKDGSGQRTDLDLSIIQFDGDMEFQGQVSYTNLSENGIIHSGDITSAPNGAAEFIDIDLKKVDSNIRYIAIQIYRFAGDDFRKLEKSYAGWMFRKETSSHYKSFDIKTVKNKFNVNGVGNYAIPLIVDLQSKEIIYVDMYMKGNYHSFNSVEVATREIKTVAKGLIDMINTRPNMYDLLTYNALGANVTIVKERELADITYGIEGCDFNINDGSSIQEVLSEMI